MLLVILWQPAARLPTPINREPQTERAGLALHLMDGRHRPLPVPIQHAHLARAAVFANLSAILQAAVDDGAIGRNPCRVGSVKPPAPDRRTVVPWPAERVAAVAVALPGRYQAPMAPAGLGLRQAECFGLAVDDVDFLRGVVHVRRQIRIVASRLTFAPPKTGKTRDVPLPESVALALAAHLEACRR